MKEKACQQMSFTDWLKSVIAQWLVGFTRQKKERKNHAACVLAICCCLTRVINGKIIEDEVGSVADALNLLYRASAN